MKEYSEIINAADALAVVEGKITLEELKSQTLNVVKLWSKSQNDHYEKVLNCNCTL